MSLGVSAMTMAASRMAASLVLRLRSPYGLVRVSMDHRTRTVTGLQSLDCCIVIAHEIAGKRPAVGDAHESFFSPVVQVCNEDVRAGRISRTARGAASARSVLHHASRRKWLRGRANVGFEGPTLDPKAPRVDGVVVGACAQIHRGTRLGRRDRGTRIHSGVAGVFFSALDVRATGLSHTAGRESDRQREEGEAGRSKVVTLTVHRPLSCGEANRLRRLRSLALHRRRVHIWALDLPGARPETRISMTPTWARVGPPSPFPTKRPRKFSFPDDFVGKGDALRRRASAKATPPRTKKPGSLDPGLPIRS